MPNGWTRCQTTFTRERTACASVGELQSDVRSFRRLGKPIGATFIGLALLFLWIGAFRYYSVQSKLTEGNYPPARRSVIVATISILALCAAAFIAVLVLA